MTRIPFSNYNVIMRAKLVSIGNSKGIRLPRAIIDQCGLTDEIELVVQNGGLFIKRLANCREGWDAAFERMHENGDDQLLDEADAHAETSRDRTEWKW